MTLDFHDIPLRSALDLLFKDRGLNFAVDPAVPNPPITIVINNQPFGSALRTLIRIASAQAPGLIFTEEGGLFRIKMRQAPPPPPREEPPPEAVPEITELRWWTTTELAGTTETVYPEQLLDLLQDNGIGRRD